MNVRETRKFKLRQLVARHGGQARLARKIDTAPAYISQLLNDPNRNVGHEFARKIEFRLGYDDGWMDEADEPVGAAERQSDYIANAGPAQARRIPVLNYVQAGKAREVVDSYPTGEGMDAIGVDAEMASMLGAHAFAVVIEGFSMSPDYEPGDIVIVDPDASVRPGDVVVARVGRDDNATVKKYRSRGNDAEGQPIFELVPKNEDYPTERIDSSNPGEIIGPVIEHRRRLRRPNGK